MEKTVVSALLYVLFFILVVSSVSSIYQNSEVENAQMISDSANAVWRFCEVVRIKLVVFSNSCAEWVESLKGLLSI